MLIHRAPLSDPLMCLESVVDKVGKKSEEEDASGKLQSSWEKQKRNKEKWS